MNDDFMVFSGTANLALAEKAFNSALNRNPTVTKNELICYEFFVFGRKFTRKKRFNRKFGHLLKLTVFNFGKLL